MELTISNLGILFAIVCSVSTLLIQLWKTFFKEPKSSAKEIKLKIDANTTAERGIELAEANYWQNQVQPLRDRVAALEASIKAKEIAHSAELEQERAKCADENTQNKLYSHKLEESLARLTLRINELEQKGTSTS